MSNYRKLEIFEEARRLAIQVHEMSLRLPKFEIYEEGSQLRRSSKAIAALIAEGYGRRRYKKEYVKYLIYSQAECDEVTVHLDFVAATGSLKDDACYTSLKTDYDILGKKINKYIKWVDSNDIGRI